MSRFARRQDGNQKGIVEAFLKLGWSVHNPRTDAFDLLVSYAGRSGGYPVEIKNPNMPPSKRRLTDGEKKFHEDYKGMILMVETVDDVLELTRKVRNGII